MASSLASLVVSLGLDAVQFTAGLTKSEREAKRFADQLGRSVSAGIVKAQLALGALGLSVQGAVQLFDSLTEGVAKFKDLEETVGAAAADLASFAVSAATAGVEVESIGGAMNKLTKGLVGVDDEAKAAGAALAAIGLDVAQFKSLDPAAQYEAIGKALAGFADDQQKVAIAMALFGKAGAEQLKVFKALEESGGRQSILTQRQIELADAYKDSIAKSSAELRLYAGAIVAEMLPAASDLIELSKTLAIEFLGLGDLSDKLGRDGAIAQWARDSAIAAAELVGKFVALIKLGDAFVGVLDHMVQTAKTFFTIASNPGAIGEAIFKGNGPIADALADREKILKRGEGKIREFLDFDSGKYAQQIREGQDRRAAGNAPSPLGLVAGTSVPQARPSIKFDGAVKAAKSASAGENPLKKELDAQIKLIQAFAKEQAEGFAFANRYAEQVGREGLVSQREIFTAQAALREVSLSASLAAFDKEIAALEKYRARSSGKDRAEADQKIADAASKRAAAVIQASQEAILAAGQEAAAVLQAQRAYEDLLATVLEAQGKSEQSAKIRIAKQVEDAAKTVTAAGGDQSIVVQYKAALEGVQELRGAQEAYNRLLDDARAKEEAALSAAQSAGAGEIATLQAIGTARSASLAQLAAMAQAAAEMNARLQTPESQRFADELANAFKRAAKEADPLRDKLNGIADEIGAIGGNALASGKSLKEMAQGFLSDIGGIVQRELIQKPFSELVSGALKQGTAGGGFLAGIFGGKGSASTGKEAAGAVIESVAPSTLAADTAMAAFAVTSTAADGAIVAFTAATVGADAAILAMATAATSAASALSAVAVSSGSSSVGSAASIFGDAGTFGAPGDFGSFFSSLPGLATGGPALPGKTYRVNENRTELLSVNGEDFLMMGNKRGVVNPAPNVGGGGRRDFRATVNINVPSATNTRTANNIAAATSRKLQAARRML